MVSQWATQSRLPTYKCGSIKIPLSIPICHLSIVLLQLSGPVVHSLPERCGIFDFRRILVDTQTEELIKLFNKELIKPGG